MVLYRINLQLIDESTESVRRRNEKLMGYLLTSMGFLTWLPARVLMLAYALAGKFDGTLAGVFCKGAGNGNISLLHDNNTALFNVGLSALALTPEQTVGIEQIHSARRLVFRAIAICAVLIGLVTILTL